MIFHSCSLILSHHNISILPYPPETSGHLSFIPALLFLSIVIFASSLTPQKQLATMCMCLSISASTWASFHPFTRDLSLDFFYFFHRDLSLVFFYSFSVRSFIPALLFLPIVTFPSPLTPRNNWPPCACASPSQPPPPCAASSRPRSTSSSSSPTRTFAKAQVRARWARCRNLRLQGKVFFLLFISLG